MIAYLIGKVLIKKTKYLILLTNNTGYQVFVNEKTLTALTENQEAALHIHHHVKEDAEELYGFLNLPELELFKNLIAISGVGPKSALGVMAHSSVEDIIGAILSEDPALLRTVSGIGPKTAERIVVELKSKIGSLYKDSKDSWIQAAPKDVEVIEALLGLGYSRKEVMDVVRQIPDKLTETSDKIKGALKLLAK
ncbi:MAG: Holliday junction ATP-dependent DNA helicase RuvA [Parcubacteria group bacterium GW2011_GWA2_43_17]|nr:MAG: Holliday junction ATP-dependent DNA helicase RuvA [Parcubacteria group bacterium GW2011_GWA2_43_17]KKT92988.1 MAG: Holliday junction ATP-dependent DNA helicase RuvA [Parcubacteria group bacterium GW2011_GWF2_45_11]OGY92839.1 MAG: Holliday junction DNA helicase RuvA [Candidatus Komeilibacteria bacterium RIFOXYA2_FULL_45_9]OGY94534.1 MAG: Holliday junction DNA helicase RuvA [Candidatus Komeilibacteria bacterium RIFOXYC2_FULL_45_12]